MNPVFDALTFGRHLFQPNEDNSVLYAARQKAAQQPQQPSDPHSFLNTFKGVYEDRAVNRWATAGQEALRQELLRRAGAAGSEVLMRMAPAAVSEAAGPVSAVGATAYGLTRRGVDALPANTQASLADTVGGTINQAVRNFGGQGADDDNLLRTRNSTGAPTPVAQPAPRVPAPTIATAYPPLATAKSYGGDVNEQFNQALGYSRPPSGPMAPLMSKYNDALGYGGMNRR